MQCIYKYIHRLAVDSLIVEFGNLGNTNNVNSAINRGIATRKPATRKRATRKPATWRPATRRPATRRPATRRPATRRRQESVRQESVRRESVRRESVRRESVRRESMMHKPEPNVCVTSESTEQAQETLDLGLQSYATQKRSSAALAYKGGASCARRRRLPLVIN